MPTDWATSKAADHLFGDNFPKGAEVHIKRLAKLLDEVAGAAAAGENRCTRNAGHEDESWPGRPGPGGP